MVKKAHQDAQTRKPANLQTCILARLWPFKIVAKLILSRLPLGYRAWQRLGLFKHGAMEQPEYAYRVFCARFDGAEFACRDTGFVALELGPGDALLSALIAHAHGALACYLVDIGPFARRDLQPYRAMAAYLNARGLPAPDLTAVTNLDELLARCGAHYLTEGLASLKALPDRSVDFIWSQAVLEHIRRAELAETLRQLRRVLRDDGACSHRVDLKDHLGGALNHLRFPERLWETDRMARSGFYTNRVRYTEMLRLFEQAGFVVERVEADRWERLPTPRRCLAAPFRQMPDEELLVAGFDVVLRPRGEEGLR